MLKAHSKAKLKAQFPLSIWFTIFAVVFCMGIILTFGLMLMGHMKSYGIFVESSIEKLNSIDSAHAIKDCFSQGKGYIERTFLLENENKDVCEIEACQICSLEIGLRIRDLEKETGKKEWSFGFDSAKGTDHEIFVNIRDAAEIHVGKMYVQVF